MNRFRLQDFQILSGTSNVGCGNAGSFRAIHKAGRWPALLHRFRPPGIMNQCRPRFQTDIPDFRQPFQSQFLGWIQPNDSIYLVEALPDVVTLDEVWKAILWNHPDSIVPVINEMVHQILDLPKLLVNGWYGINTLVLSYEGIWGLLATHLDTTEGPIHLRPVPARYQGSKTLIEQFKAIGDMIHYNGDTVRPNPIQFRQIKQLIETLYSPSEREIP